MRTLLFLLLFGSVGCASESFQPEVKLDNTQTPFGKWEFERFADNEAFPYEVLLEIKNETNHLGQYQIYGKAAVNFYYPSFDIDFQKNTLLLHGVGSTKIAGDAQAIGFEQKYYETLVAIERYELSNNGETLTLYLPSKTTQYLVFKKI